MKSSGESMLNILPKHLFHLKRRIITREYPPTRFNINTGCIIINNTGVNNNKNSNTIHFRKDLHGFILALIILIKQNIKFNTGLQYWLTPLFLQNRGGSNAV